MTRERWLALIVLVVLGRGVVLGGAIAAERWAGEVGRSAPDAEGIRARVSDAPILASLSSWDTVYYVDIAQRGYSQEPVNGSYPNTVFFPLFPATIRIVHDITGLEWGVIAILTANVAFIAACLVIVRLSVAFSQTHALVAVGLVSFGPGSTAFSMGYSDSLLLLLSATALLLVERGRIGAAGLAYALAAACRPTGILLGLPLLLLCVESGRGRRQPLALLAGPFGLAGVVLLQWIQVGDPVAFVRGQQAWARVPSGGTLSTASGGSQGAGELALGIGILSLVIFIAYSSLATVQLLRGRPRAYGLHAFLGVVSSLAFGRLVSADRYLVAQFPLAWPTAVLPRPLLIALSIASLAYLGLASYLSFSLVLPP
jgi:hypothetical protein